MEQTTRNALADQTSPYLLEHADNPVHWYPWGEEALRLARTLDRPLLVSIGYSACHWCHVMARESFRNPATAAVMNEHFINVKVDREERPDLDRVYQLAHQLLTGRPGGWPLTVFVTPDDLTPFFAGTYFPPRPKHGLPAFTQVLERVAEFYATRRQDIRAQNASLREALASIEAAPGGGALPGSEVFTRAVEEAAASFDSVHGGFGTAPKFPHPPMLAFLARQAARGDPHAQRMVTFTARRMTTGGLYDQLAGGFFRYCVDGAWQVPHFEKMLSDNGQLLALYAELALLEPANPLWRPAVLETAAWLVAEMRLPSGAFASSLDADTEGREGGHYVWSRSEIEQALPDDERELVVHHFGLNRRPNFDGRWHLTVVEDLPALAERFSLPVDEVAARLSRARRRLLELRSRRPRPHRDDKVLTAWNALAAEGLIRAGAALGRPELVGHGIGALEFIQANLWRDRRLLASWRQGRAQLDAYLDDHAFLLAALLASLGPAFEPSRLAFARAIADALIERFEDTTRGGFFFTAHDHEPLPVRLRPFADDATPAGNAVAAWALQRLGHVLGETRYLESAERTLQAAADGLARQPSAHHTLLGALAEHLEPPQLVVIRARGEALARWRDRALAAPAVQRQVVAIDADVGALPGLLAGWQPRGEAVAYVCSGHQCDAPITDWDSFDARLAASEARPGNG